MIGRPPTPALSRFWAKIQVEETGCWSWRGHTNRGYAHFRHGPGPSRSYAHRWSYETFVGLTPDGLQLDHLCPNRGCVNPFHLEPVSPRENTLRSEGITAQLARRGACSRGHDFTPDNMRLTARGRECRTCRRLIDRAYRERKKASA